MSSPSPLSTCAQPFKLTAQQYSECWRERVEKENRTITLGFGMGDAAPSATAAPTAAPPAATAAAAAAPPTAEKDDDAVSVRSYRSDRSDRSKRSDVSSNVSTSSATERKLKLLEAQLESERTKRKELEELLKAQKSTS